MKRREIKDLLLKPNEQLLTILNEYRNQIAKNTLQKYSGRSKKIVALKDLKKNIARILTKIRERKLSA